MEIREEPESKQDAMDTIIGLLFEYSIPIMCKSSIDGIMVYESDLYVLVEKLIKLASKIYLFLYDGEDEKMLKMASNQFKDTPLRLHIRDIIDNTCLLYTSPSPRDRTRSRMPSSA